MNRIRAAKEMCLSPPTTSEGTAILSQRQGILVAWEQSNRLGERVCDLLYSISDNSPRLAGHRGQSRFPQFRRHNWGKFQIALGIERRAPSGLLRCVMVFCSCRSRTAQLCTIRAIEATNDHTVLSKVAEELRTTYPYSVWASKAIPWLH